MYIYSLRFLIQFVWNFFLLQKCRTANKLKYRPWNLCYKLNHIIKYTFLLFYSPCRLCMYAIKLHLNLKWKLESQFVDKSSKLINMKNITPKTPGRNIYSSYFHAEYCTPIFLNITRFRPLNSLAFIRCLSIWLPFRAFRTETFI